MITSHVPVVRPDCSQRARPNVCVERWCQNNENKATRLKIVMSQFDA